MQDIVTRTSVPSFLQSVPSSLRSVLDDSGLPAAAKIQATEWHNLSTIYLPLALISYCSSSSYLRGEASQARLQEVVDHTMDLVQAVRIAFKRSIDPSDVSAYDGHIQSYVHKLEIVHPNASAMPFTHMALHVKDYLQLFGPVYSWMTYPLGNFIRKLENVLGDARTGEYTIHIGIRIHSDTVL